MGKKFLTDKLHIPGIHTYDVYRANGGYKSVEKALNDMTPDTLVDEVKKSGKTYKAFKFPFLANGRSLAAGNKEGFVKLISDEKNHLIGAHIIATHASEMIAELVMAMEFGASIEDLALTIHAHPTLSEAVKEAALGLSTGTLNL